MLLAFDLELHHIPCLCTYKLQRVKNHPSNSQAIIPLGTVVYAVTEAQPAEQCAVTGNRVDLTVHSHFLCPNSYSDWFLAKCHYSDTFAAQLTTTHFVLMANEFANS